MSRTLEDFKKDFTDQSIIQQSKDELNSFFKESESNILITTVQLIECMEESKKIKPTLIKHANPFKNKPEFRLSDTNPELIDRVKYNILDTLAKPANERTLAESAFIVAVSYCINPAPLNSIFGLKERFDAIGFRKDQFRTYADMI